ncbi:MAG: hypothetical protein JRD39_06990, partial [Deltaproteobacteria bacterium]|nr:hypothetical protein [Deltaproteobacteria bacterium]
MKALARNIHFWLILAGLACIVLLGFAAVTRYEDRNERTENGEHFFL